MKLRHYDLHIPSEKHSDPFENCKLGRKKYADVLTDIVDGYADGFVLAINNPWGEGKTTFVKMWRQHLINNEFPTLYFNAWENDFQEDVLVALISELSELENKPEKQFKDVLKKVVPLTGKLIPKILKHLIIRYGGDEAAQDLGEVFGEYTEDQLKELTESYKDRKESIKKFRESLEVFASEAGGEKPLVFIIDELDRCRPDYAVQLLEQIKHLFSVSGIVYVLSIDKIQLGNAIRGFYGSDRIDADEYLRRFIDLEYSIPSPEIPELVDYFYEYFDFNSFLQSEIRHQSNELRDERFDFKFFAGLLLRTSPLSIRQLEKLFAHTRLVLNSFNESNYIFPRLFLLLNYIKKIHPEKIRIIQQKQLTIQELIDDIESLFLDKYIDVREIRPFIYTVVELAVFYKNYYEKDWQDLRTKLFFKDENGIEMLAISSSFDKSLEQSELVNAYKSIRYKVNPHRVSIEYLIKKIELLEKLNL